MLITFFNKVLRSVEIYRKSIFGVIVSAKVANLTFFSSKELVLINGQKLKQVEVYINCGIYVVKNKVLIFFQLSFLMSFL